MSLDQDQSDDDLKAVFDMVDDDQSGLLDKDEVALVMEFFSGACVQKQAGASASWFCPFPPLSAVLHAMARFERSPTSCVCASVLIQVTRK